MSNEEEKPVRWAIMGTGKVANDFVMTLRTLPKKDARIVRAAARSELKAKAFAKTHSVPIGCTYDDVYAAKDVDVVYVATIHPAHYDQVKRCIESGKHVLCEKPMTLSEKRTSALLNLAKKHNVMLQEAMWTRFFPAVKHARKLMRDGEIGEIMAVQSTFGCLLDWEEKKDAASSSDKQRHRVIDRKLGGSAVLDIGVYPVGHALMAFDSSKPFQISASGTRNSEDDEEAVDVTVGLNLTFEKRKVASLLCTIAADLPNETIFVGDGGMIKLHAPSHAPTRLTVRKRKARGTFDEQTIDFPLPKIEVDGSAVFNYPNSEGFRYEAEAMTAAVRARLDAKSSTTSTTMQEYTEKETLASARITDAARRSLGVFWSA